MDYKEKYITAREKASKLSVQNPFDTVGQMVEYIFPELKETEDERIRKGIIDFIKHESDIYGIKTWCHGYTTEEIIAWLEKQGEHLSLESTNKI